MRRSLISKALICASFFLFAVATQGQSDRSARLANLTADVAERAANGRLADSDFVSAAKSRFALMSKLAETDPQAVLDNALTDEQLARIPQNARAYFERRERLRGEIEVMAECEEHEGRIHRYLLKDGQRFELASAGEVDERITSGNEVELNGVLIGDRAVFESDQLKAVGSEPTTNSLSNTTGEKRVLVILVNFQDKATQPFTVEQARNVTFNTTSNYFYENSYGQTWLTGDVYGWYTIPMSSTVCDKNAIGLAARQAAESAGAVITNYDHLVYAFPSNACTFSGSSTIGGNPSQSWVNHFYTVSTLGHELGHGLGLYHSRSLDCGVESVGQSCTSSEYGNVFDIMGGGATAHMNLFQKERLGWLNQAGVPPIETVTSSGTYWVDAYETATSNVKGLKILKSIDPVSGKKTWYYLEHRTPTGFDSYLASSNYNVINGVSIHQGSETSGVENYLLDMTPATTSWYDPALTVGQTFSDPAAGITITVLSADNSGATVRVEMNAQPCVRANPTLTLAPDRSSWMRAGSVYRYQLNLTNNNSGGCVDESFNIGANLPAGFNSSLSVSSIVLANGGSATVYADVTSPLTASDGNHNFSVSAASQTNSVSASGTYVLVSALAVSASPGALKYSRSQTAVVTAIVSAAGAPTANVDVTFQLVKPSGSTVTQTVRTGSDGKAVFSYKFNRKADPTGTYTVNANAMIKGYSGSATTSFLVNK
jgi:5-hydroxyisourate hydrolase-like protein (transthyretin family)